mmetsp:Transcript_52288/g.113632  ORF Transcript_52288/g.113632 Transcript_52288/m.113632 type:complete len:219 (+) Transcript_52288:3-659(+)
MGGGPDETEESQTRLLSADSLVDNERHSPVEEVPCEDVPRAASSKEQHPSEEALPAEVLPEEASGGAPVPTAPTLSDLQGTNVAVGIPVCDADQFVDVVLVTGVPLAPPVANHLEEHEKEPDQGSASDSIVVEGNNIHPVKISAVSTVGANLPELSVPGVPALPPVRALQIEEAPPLPALPPVQKLPDVKPMPPIVAPPPIRAPALDFSGACAWLNKT